MAQLSPQRRHLRATKARLAQMGADTTALDADIKMARMADEIAREAAADPPLSTEQRIRLASLLLRSGGDSNAAA